MKPDYEERLKKLLSANEKPAREAAALEWKKQGKKIIGVTDANVPEEVIHAAGMLPWRLTGTRDADISLAHSYHSTGTDVYCCHLLQSLLNGEFDFLDGVVISCEDDDIRRLKDTWDYIGKTPFTHLLYAPHTDKPAVRRGFAEAIGALKSKLEQLSGSPISDAGLADSIDVYNRWRTLLEKVYELRKKEQPPLTGTEYLKLVTASFVMPKEDFNAELEALMPHLEQRQIAVDKNVPRLIVCADKLDNPEYLEFIEGLGCLIAMDDLDTGSRYFWKTTALEKDPIEALADRYITRPTCPHTVDWPKYVDQVKMWVNEYNIAGVLNLSHLFGYIRQIITPYFSENLTKAGIPVMNYTIDYPLTNIEQLRTRVGAFLEILENQSPA